MKKNDEATARTNNPQMHDLICRYIEERTDQGEITGSSPRVMRCRLMSFAAYCAEPPFTVTKHDIREWVRSLDAKPASVRAYLATLAGFYRWLNEEDLVAHDPTVGVKRPRLAQGEKRSLSAEEVERVRRVLPDVRAQLMFSLMLNEALRVGEVAAIQLHDIDFSRGIVHVRGKGYQGQRSRSIPLTQETLAYAKEYLAKERIEAGHLIRSAAAGHEHDGLTANSITRFVTQWLKDAGVKRCAGDGISAHSLRHTAAEDFAERTSDIRIVQAVLGHKNLATTQTYLRNEIKGIAEIQQNRGVIGV
jgi:integrase